MGGPKQRGIIQYGECSLDLLSEGNDFWEWAGTRHKKGCQKFLVRPGGPCCDSTCVLQFRE